MSQPSLEEMLAFHKKENQVFQEILEKMIPVPGKASLYPNVDYHVEIRKYDDSKVKYLWMSSALRNGVPDLLSFFSETATFEITVGEGLREERSCTTLFKMFMKQGKVAVITFDYNDIPFGETFRVFIAGDLSTSQKEKVRFGSDDFYTAYRRNFIDLKLAQDVAKQYLKEGIRSPKVVWDEFLW